MTEEQEATFGTLDTILADEATFESVIADVFKGIDTDASGKLDEEELGHFISEVCAGMQIAMPPGKDNIKEVFEELDTDHNKSIDQKELGTFLRKLFTDQRNELAKALGKPLIS
jgi:Ca2+-binding EF-hand superfamily protein